MKTVFYPNFKEILQQQKNIYKKKPFVHYGGEKLEYKKLLSSIDKISQLLIHETQCDTIGIHVDKFEDRLVSIFATLCCGKSFVILNKEEYNHQRFLEIHDDVFLLNDRVIDELYSSDKVTYLRPEKIYDEHTFCYELNTESGKYEKHTYGSFLQQIFHQINQQVKRETTTLCLQNELISLDAVRDLMYALFEGRTVKVTKTMTIKSPHIKTFYFEEGVRPNVLFFAATDGKTELYQPLMDRLTSHCNVFTIQCDTKELFSPSNMINKLVSYIDQFPISFSMHVGYAFSGFLAYQCAVESKNNAHSFLINTPTIQHFSSNSYINNELAETWGILKQNTSLAKMIWKKASKYYLKLSTQDAKSKMNSFEKDFINYYNPLNDELPHANKSNVPITVFISPEQRTLQHEITSSYEWGKISSQLIKKEHLEKEKPIFDLKNTDIIIDNILKATTLIKEEKKSISN
ncbi:hypothetical protein [Flammeovirga agarivorans]|uniref:Uncharacterized protein n=1 Tax=Flammeovirga agarivorans TaxID=2726742 RepID=A0A7X8SJX4_9BACT|nr:hypothetical protein [Flammeovirga agarivorans]NLR91603.1 hypothetical protein [Flammeovirga agarivorans]